MKQITLTKRESVFIPIKDITPQIRERIKEKRLFRFYEDKACKQCEWYAERHCDICDNCPAFKGGYQLSPTVKIGDNKYVKVPVGSHEQIVSILENKGYEVKIRDKSPKKPIQKIKFLGKFREGQETAIKHMLEDKRGVIKAPPRSGKTVSSTAAVCKLSKKTLFLASQREWLLGFQETFIGSATQKPLTDLDPKRIKLCKTLKDFQTHDICLATVQTFYSESGEKLLRKIRDEFEVIVIDEVHTGAADKYIQIIAKLNARYMIGLSATPSRKDAKFVLVRHVVGPTIHEVVVERMRPRVRLTRTAFQKTYKGNVRWTTMVSSLENDPKRLKLIAETAIKDVKDGHMVMIPFSQVKPIKKLVALINEMAGKKLAYEFTGTLHKKVRESTVQGARQYKVKILVGTMKILSTGLNIPRASALYEVAMSSNLENAEQRMARVLTFMEGKPEPIIRYFLDNSNVRRNCMRNEYMNVLKRKFKPIISERDQILLETYLKQSAKSQENHAKFDL